MTTNLGISATLSGDARTFTLTRDDWWNTYPVEDLPAWLAFYRRMLKQTGRTDYHATIAALEGVQDQLRDRGPRPTP